MSSLSRDEIVPLRRFASLIITVSLTALGVAVIAAACWFFVPPIAKTPAFNAQFSVLPGFLYAGQPAKSVAFETCCLAAPFLLFLSFCIARPMVTRSSSVGLRRIVNTGLALHLFLWSACVVPVFYCPHPPLWISPRWLLVPRAFPPPAPAWEWMVSLVAGAFLVFFFVTQPAGRPARNRAMVPILLLWLLLAPTRFFAPSEITDELHFTYHLNSVLDALSQAANGHHLLVDFPHIYGGYVEILGLILAFLPRTIGAPLLALAIPSVLSVLFLLLTARLVIRQPGHLFLASLGLLSCAFLVSLPDPNYGYNTARTFFPALGLFLAALYFQRPGPDRYLATSLVAALAPIWNLDTGLVLWGSWLVTLLAAWLVGWSWSRFARHLAIQVGLLVAAWALFFFYLRLVSGFWPDPHQLFYFQALVVQSGYFCVPLLVPNIWISLVLLYLAGLAVALISHLHGPVNGEARMILLLSLIGGGTFSYYMGRSAEPNLIAVCPPGVLLLALLANKTNRQVRRGQTPAIARWFFFPWAAMVIWWVFLLFAQLPFLLARGPQLLRDWRETNPTPFEVRAALVERWIHPHEDGVYFLSNHSGFYYYLTQTVRPLRIPGNIELLRTADMNVLIAAIRDKKIARLVVDPNFQGIDMYRPEIYQAINAAIAQNYQPLETADGLTLCVPRLANALP